MDVQPRLLTMQYFERSSNAACYLVNNENSLSNRLYEG